MATDPTGAPAPAAPATATETHLTIAKTIHSANFWLAVVSAVLVILVQGFGLHVNNTAIMSGAGIIISLVLGGSAVAKAHVQAAQALAQQSMGTPGGTGS